MSIDPEELRQAMRSWATGVTVVSAFYEGVRHGMTVNSFTSIALEPPLLLVSLERGARTHDLVSRVGYFGVTVLRQEQREISERFSGRDTEHLDRFENLETFSLVSYSPLLAGGLVSFDCRVVSSHDVATHTLFLGEVLGVRVGVPGQPLIYFEREYWGLKSNEHRTDPT